MSKNFRITFQLLDGQSKQKKKYVQILFIFQHCENVIIKINQHPAISPMARTNLYNSASDV